MDYSAICHFGDVCNFTTITWYWWFSARLYYLQCLSTGDTAVSHWPIIYPIMSSCLGFIWSKLIFHFLWNHTIESSMFSSSYLLKHVIFKIIFRTICTRLYLMSLLFSIYTCIFITFHWFLLRKFYHEFCVTYIGTPLKWFSLFLKKCNGPFSYQSVIPVPDGKPSFI